MEISVFERNKNSKNKRLRLEGNVPGVIYSAGKETEAISLKYADLQAALRQIPKGRLSTMIFTLCENNKKRKAIVKDIQYNITSYNVIHVDFLEIYEDRMINAKVPIECAGVSECQGVKLGGLFRQAIHSLRVKCLPKDLPKEFVIDVKDLNLGAVIRLSDLKIPEGVFPLGMMQEVVVVVSKGKEP